MRSIKNLFYLPAIVLVISGCVSNPISEKNEPSKTATETAVSQPAKAEKTIEVSPEEELGTIDFINADFEQPNTVKQKGFKDVPGWAMDGAVKDSGIETGSAYSGSWGAYLMAGDGLLYSKGSSAAIDPGKYYKLLVAAKANWQGLFLEMSVYGELEGKRIPLVTKTVSLENSFQIYALYFSGSAFAGFAAGTLLSIGFENATFNKTGESWMAMDIPTLILVSKDTASEVLNAKIAGMKETAIKVPNSDFEKLNPAKQTNLDYKIGKDEIYKLTFDAKSTIQGKALRAYFFTIIYGTHIPLVTGTVGIGDAKGEYTLYFSASDCPAAIGNQIGIAFENATLDFVEHSWLALDNIRLSIFK